MQMYFCHRNIMDEKFGNNKNRNTNGNTKYK